MNLAHEAQGTMNREKLYSSRQREPSRSGVSLLSQLGAFGALGPCGQCLYCDLGLVPCGLVPEIAGQVEERRLHTPFGSRLSTQRRSQFPEGCGSLGFAKLPTKGPRSPRWMPRLQAKRTIFQEQGLLPRSAPAGSKLRSLAPQLLTRSPEDADSSPSTSLAILIVDHNQWEKALYIHDCNSR